MKPHLRYHKGGRISSQPCRNGFTLIESLIAGLLLTFTMTGIARISVSALSGSSHLAERRRVETAIDDHIQLVQQADSLLTYKRLPSNHLTGENNIPRACRFPAEYLAKILKEKGKVNPDNWRDEPGHRPVTLLEEIPNPRTEQTNIKTNYDYNEDIGLVQITYNFTGPEANIKEESRSLELSPNFQSYCTPYEAL